MDIVPIRGILHAIRSFPTIFSGKNSMKENIVKKEQDDTILEKPPFNAECF